MARIPSQRIAKIRQAIQRGKMVGLPRSERNEVIRKALDIKKNPNKKKDIADIEGKKGDQTATLHRLKK